eukprot:gene20432-22446_t
MSSDERVKFPYPAFHLFKQVGCSIDLIGHGQQGQRFYSAVRPSIIKTRMMNTLLLSIFVFAVTARFGTCLVEDKFFYKFKTSTEDTRSVVKINSSLPVHFYDKKHKSIYAHNNGFVTFKDIKVWSPDELKKNEAFAPCMVEIQDFNNLGKFSIHASRDPSELFRATSDVFAHFTQHSDFVARELVVITWHGLPSKKSTVQAVLMIGQRKSFIQFLFKNEDGLSLGNVVENMNAQSGFSYGDRTRFTELLDSRSGRNMSLLFKTSSTMTAGKWIFFTGSSDDKSFFQIQEPDSYLWRDAVTRRRIRKDIDECVRGISPCHTHADCSNLDPGYSCTCRDGYIGNGKICTRKDGRVKLIGKFTGIVNNAAIPDADLDAFMDPQRGDLYVTVGPVGPKAGYYLQMVPPIIGLLGWLFSPSKQQAGFDIVGDRFIATSVVIFKTGQFLALQLLLFALQAANTGEALKVTQRMKGFDSFNFLIFDTKIEGYMPLPVVKDSSIHRFEPHTESYEVATRGKVYSSGSMTYILDDRHINYTMNRLVTFEPRAKNLDYKATVKVTNPIGSYIENSQLLMYAERLSTISSDSAPTNLPTKSKSTKAPQPTSAAIPVTTGDPEQPKATDKRLLVTRKTLKPTRKTTIKEIFTKKSSSPSNVKDSIESTQRPTAKEVEVTERVKTTTSPVSRNCNGDVCSEFAICRRNSIEDKCVCKEGYVGNGTICNVDRRIKCGSYMCHENGGCLREQSQYFCKCKKGFVGDGVNCKLDLPCKCHFNAECYSNGKGSKYCLCKRGFIGDGRQCRDIDECTETKISCQSHSKCVNTIGSFDCVCDKGFRKNGSKCLADCPRCLNGGTCVGKFGCKCAPGFSGVICQWVGDEFLLYSQGGNIKRFSYPYGSMSYGYIYRNPQHLMVGVDYNCKEKKVYWTDITSKSIQRSNYDGSEMETIITGLYDPQGLAIDWLGKNLYWTESGRGEIKVASLDGKNRKTLIKDNLKNPRPIVCNPYTGQLFWADWDRRKPRIEVSSMDGSGRRVLVSRDVGLPNGLTIDYKSREICWTDAALQGLCCIGFDGRNQRMIAQKSNLKVKSRTQIGYPFGITMHHSTILWTNWMTDNIGRFDMAENKAESEMRSGFGQDGKILDIKSVSACPARKNVCSQSNGGCSHFCLLRSDGGRTCACPDNDGQDNDTGCVETSE